MSAVLRDVRRGEADDELELIDAEGRVTILHAHGVGPDERRRTREAALALLLTAVRPVGDARA